MSRLLSAKFTSSTRGAATTLISVTVAALMVLLGAGDTAHARPNQAPQSYRICGATDASGRFSIPTR
jgi:hypothetical protein